MGRFLAAVCWLAIFPIAAAEGVPVQVAADELRPLAGADWHGILTYRDYRSGGEVSIPAEASVTEQKGEFVLEIRYPDEPHMNGTQIIEISEDGQTFMGAPLIVRRTLDDGNLELTTEETGEDNGRSATIRQTYVLGAALLIIRKDVQFDTEEGYLQRNEFRFER